MASVELYDATLRDGAQSEGISFSLVDKLHIARKLDELGIHYIEGGWPGSTGSSSTALRSPLESWRSPFPSAALRL